ncbi:MAG TPA: 2-amino-4-hydroxy-6-hydroxymethyldihydropteridine diphosphokinase [Gemmatimonadaceae bacterium]|nr:2-amino-4-hydroxy-6-hydroxymethyldihydropteridine diphosphokinase [Gemmatimonadaceae bacterium]
MIERAFIALGSNVGNREGYLASARVAVATLPGTRMLAASGVEETAPFGAGAQGAYLNQMLAVATRLPPQALLRGLQAIERSLGRVRSRRWGARTIDLDIVRFGRLATRSRELSLPHPGIPQRDFWQRELAELGSLLSGQAA